MMESLIAQGLLFIAINKTKKRMFHIVVLKFGMKALMVMVLLVTLLVGMVMWVFLMEKEMLFIHIMVIIEFAEIV